MSWGLITAMGHVAIQTTRLEESVWDATKILGLHETGRNGDTVFLAAAPVHHELSYTASEVDGIDHIGLVAADAAALVELRARVDAGGFEIVSDTPLEAGIADGFAFVGPEGFVYEIYIGMDDVPFPELSFGPDRFGHINLHPQDLEAYTTFLETVLDFRISDRIMEDVGVFLRCNSDHHGIALIAGRGHMHHHAWQGQSIVDLGKLGDRLDHVGRQLIWGPVRHGAGHNIAAYFVEPAGGVIELYTDLEQIYDDNRPPVLWTTDKWVNKWGTYRGDDFRSHGLFPVPRGAK